MRFPRFLILATAAAVLVAAVGFLVLRRPRPISPELATPKLALEHLVPFPGSRLFFTPQAVPFLKPDWPKWHLAEGEYRAIEDVAGQFDRAAQNKQAWRALDRNFHFSAVLLTGDPALFRPLLDHLVNESPDWTLTWVDHTSLIFQRSPARKWVPADLESLKALFATHSSAERVELRVQIAHRLTNIGQAGLAKPLLAEALQIDSKSASALTELACACAALGDWEQALATAERTVALDRDYLPALVAKTNALYAVGRFNEALLSARKVIAKTPEDGQNLALLAKVTHAAHAYREEIETLEKIVRLSQEKGLSTGTWRIYLAQAYAADCQPEPALAQFEAALKEPDTTDEARAFAQKGIGQIKSRKPVF